MMIHIQLSEAHKHCAEITRYKLEISFNKFSCPAPSSSVFLFPTKLYGSFVDVIFKLTVVVCKFLNFTEPRISIC